MQFRNLLLIGALSVPALASAETIQYQAVIRAQLETVNSTRFTEGELFLDGRSGLVELTVQPKMPECPEGMMCAQVMPERQTYSLEGATSTVDHCGIISTTVEADARPVDGYFTKIVVRNNQNNTCPTLVALKAVDVNFEQAYYDRIQGKEVKFFDRFASDNVALINPADKGGDVPFAGQIGKVTYADKILTLELSHGGGCKEHAFDLKFGECKKVKLLNSTIDQCDVTVLHTQGSNDMCRAFITKKYQIDLSGYAQAYVLKIGNQKVLVH